MNFFDQTNHNFHLENQIFYLKILSQKFLPKKAKFYQKKKNFSYFKDFYLKMHVQEPNYCIAYFNIFMTIF